MHKNRSRGFTLIELLVVIAIIGILSAVVLASLNTARTKGSDASVKANLNTVGTQAALFLLDTNSYGTFNNGAGAPADCPVPSASGSTLFHNTTVKGAIASALTSSGGGVAKCMSTDSAYAVAVSRPDTTNSTYWCVDHTGSRCGINSLITGASCGACASSQ